MHGYLQEEWEQNINTFNTSWSGVCCLCYMNQGLFLHVVTTRKMGRSRFSFKKNSDAMTIYIDVNSICNCQGSQYGYSVSRQ